MYFTQEDYIKIQKWLLAYSIKDTEFNKASLPFFGNETVAIVQNGKNLNVSLNDLINQLFLLGVSDFLNVTNTFNERDITLLQAIQLIPYKSRKIGQVITFINEEGNWVIYQFQGKLLNQWNDLTVWVNILSGIGPSPINVVDNLTSTSTKDALSANQGRILNESINSESTRAKESEEALQEDINTKQDKLVSGETIKTINNESILGSGNITVASDLNVIDNLTSSSAKDALSANQGRILDGKIKYATDLVGQVEELLQMEINEERNRASLAESNLQINIDKKQDILVSGDTIKTINGESLLGSGDIIISGIIVRLTTAEYNNLTYKDPNILYAIVD